MLKKDSFLATKSFNTDMDKMLARKAHMFEKVEISRNTVILTIIKCLLKVAYRCYIHFNNFVVSLGEDEKEEI